MEGRYNLTFPQKNIWLENKLYNSSSVNLITGIININKGFNIGYCKEAINYIIKNNDSMRIHIFSNGSIVYQKIEDYVFDDIEVIKIENENQKKLFIKKFKSEDMDIQKGKLYSFKILNYGNDKGSILLKMHHIISDAWSYSKIIEQFVKNYESLEKTGNVVEDEVPSYISYINSTEEYKNSEKFSKDEEFWKEYLDGISSKVSIKDNTKKIGNKSSRYNVKLNKELNDKIINYCKNNKISLYVMFLTAFFTYMYRITEKNDMVIGTPSLNRSNFKEKQMIGMFVSTLPLRVKIHENIKFLDLAHEIAKNTMSIFRHQRYPYVKTLKNIREKNKFSDNLYSMILSYQNARVEFEDKKKYDTKWYENDFQNEDLQIHILDMDNTGILEMNYDYLNELFSKKEIEYLHTRIIAIMENAILDENIDVENIEIMSKAEKNKILYEFNDTKNDYKKDKSVIELFEEQVKKHPNDIALIFENEKLTYEELNNRANAVANFLIENGVNPNDKIAICMKRNIKLIVTLIATLKCRATYIPIDITYPSERINYILNNSKPKIIISEKEINNETIIYANDEKFGEIYEKFSNKLDKIDVKSENINSYIIYTSGSTGNPKGVVISNSNLLNFIIGINKKVNIKKGDNVASITTVCFDIFGLEIWVTLSYGATMVLANEVECVNGNELSRLCEKSNVSIIQTTPTKLKLLLNDNNSFFMKNIKKVILGGEKIGQEFIDKLKEITKAEIYDGYGPSETTIYSTIKKLDSSKVNAGKPIDNTYIYILDSKNRLLPINTSGQLAIAGDSVSTGYYKNDEITRKSFVYDKNLGKRIYLTGDLCKLNFSGELCVLERIDLQVKVNGQRVELQEIEKNINKFHNIKNNIVSLKDNKLVCFYTLKEKENGFDKNSMIKFLYEKLPIYMIPGIFVLQEKFPMTLNGKIDRKKLCSTYVSVEENKKNIMPSTKIQDSIYKVWQKVIKKTNFGVNDNFFELGTDSLDAIKIQIELLNIGIHIEYEDLFKYPTIIELEKMILDKELINKAKYRKNIELIQNNYSNNKKYNEVLISNSDESYVPKKIKVKNILLTGATGFLGSHILDEFMKNETGKIYCIVREKNDKDCTQRLREILNFYFGDKYDDEIGNRIIPITADITDYEKLKDGINNIINDINLVVNSAACVKHHGDTNFFKKINVDSAYAIAKLCYEKKLKLIHISTVSVSGNAFETSNYNLKNSKGFTFDETCFYKNQNLENVYVCTKFKAEQIVLDYMLKGLQANIVRIGNLTNRYSDLKFQYNAKDNAFANRIKTLISLKIFPENNKDMYLEFTPVDVTAEAIIKIMQYFNVKHNMFHLYDNKHVYIKRFFEILKKENIEIKIVTQEEFAKKITQVAHSSKRDILAGIINDLGKNNELNYLSNIKIKCDYTISYLKKIGFEWPEIEDKYIIKYIENVK